MDRWKVLFRLMMWKNVVKLAVLERWVVSIHEQSFEVSV